MKEQIDKVIGSIKEFCDSVYAVELYDKKGMIIEIVNYIENDINLAINDKEIKAPPENLIKDIISFLVFLQYVYFEVPMHQRFCNFVNDITLLLSNWNNNIGKNEEITKLTRIIKLTYDQWATLEILLHHTKNVIHMLNNKHTLTYDFIPELSRHYLKSFCDTEDKKDVNNC
jgi:hypothetical protein